MSQISAIAFLLLAGAGIASCQVHSIRAAQVLSLSVIAIALFALSALGYHGLELGVDLPFNPVALHTAVLLLMLSLGWLAARPDVGFMRVLSARSAGGAVARRALLPSLLVPSLLSYVAQVMQSRGWISPDVTITLLAVASGGMVAWIIWSVSVLLDRVDREKRITSHLREDANTDELTQVGNRRAFHSAIAGLLRRRRDEDAVFSLLMLDLDRFKSFNDTFGHVAGDQALRQVGQLLKAALRPGDVAARFGGEEFAVLLPGIDGERAVLVAERIRRDFHIADWPDRLVTVSIGVAQCHAHEEEEKLVAGAPTARLAPHEGGRRRGGVGTAPPP
ncbi:MAG: GGDEF domain-containing protein, partial [Arenimonas sp.]|nr:GGDEF domain-containing protein [Arenimonas sp.]